MAIFEIAKNGFWSKRNFVKLVYLISRVFLAWTFLNFLAHSGSAFARNVEILADGGVIRITNLQPSNEGRFECNATNIAGSMTAVAFLKVNIPPSLTVSPQGSIQVKVGENVQLQCVGQGDPVPKVFWEKINGYM